MQLQVEETLEEFERRLAHRDYSQALTEDFKARPKCACGNFVLHTQYGYGKRCWACAVKANKVHRERVRQRRLARFYVTCPDCGSEFTKNGCKRYCDECRDRRLMQRRIESNHRNYLKHAKHIRARIHDNYVYKTRREWQAQIKERKDALVSIITANGSIRSIPLFAELHSKYPQFKESDRTFRIHLNQLAREGIIRITGKLTGVIYHAGNTQ